MEEASEKTGLSDFGPDSFREGLEHFLVALEAEIAPTGQETGYFYALAHRRLCNRLKIEETYRLNPKIASLSIGGPVAVLGLPRTGTTALTNMLSLDRRFRPLRMWEQEEPCPPPVLEEEEKDPRRLAAIKKMEQLAREQPKQMAMHLWNADSPEEDPELLGLDFKAQQAATPIFDYHAWWRDADLRPTFAYHRRTAQLLQWRRPPNLWLFKAPAYNFHLDAFLSAYPEARFIQTHRDPAKSVPSAISFMASLVPREAIIDPCRYGRLHAEHLRIGIQKAMAARARIGEDRFLDIYHHDLQGDGALNTIARVYRFMGMEFEPHVRDAVQNWQAVNRTGAFGAHEYTAEQFGLSNSQLRADFATYVQRFDL